MERYRDLAGAVANRQAQMLKMLGELVRLESPYGRSGGVNRCVTLLEGWIRATGGKAGAANKRRLGTCCWAASDRFAAPPNP